MSRWSGHVGRGATYLTRTRRRSITASIAQGSPRRHSPPVRGRGTMRVTTVRRSARWPDAPRAGVRCPAGEPVAARSTSDNGTPQPLPWPAKHPPLRRGSIAGPMFRPHIPRPIVIVMPEVERLNRHDRPATPRTQHTAALHPPLPHLSKLLVHMPISPRTHRLRGRHHSASAKSGRDF